VRYEHPPIASLLIGAAQEADPVSPGFQQSTAISNHSNLDFTLHYREQRIILPGDASWKRLCSSSVPPDDDDESYRVGLCWRSQKSGVLGPRSLGRGIQHDPVETRFTSIRVTISNLVALNQTPCAQVGFIVKFTVFYHVTVGDA